MLKINKMQENKRNERKGQPKGQNYRRTKFRRDFFEWTEKEGEEKNNSSTQAKGWRREKSSLTTQENFWCVKL